MSRWRFLLPAIAVCAAGSAAPVVAASASANGATTPAAQAVYAFNSGLALTAAATPGAAVRIQPAGGAAQQWIFGANGAIALAADPHLCLTVPGASFLSGTKLDVTACHARAAQRFARTSPSGHSPVYFIAVAAHRGLCAADLAGLLSAGDRIGLRPCASLITQAWSGTNLAGRAALIGNHRTMQARRPGAGSFVTGALTVTGDLDQYWTAGYAGAQTQDLVRLHPVDDTSLCLTATVTSLPMRLESCDGTTSQEFMATALYYSADGSAWFLTTPDAGNCVQTAGGTAPVAPVAIGRCASRKDVWFAALPLNRLFYSQYVELYADSGSLRFSMTVAASGGPGSTVTVQADLLSPGQVWTDLAAGPSQPPGNADGSISLRPLSNQTLCLTVPKSHYAADVQLTVQSCAGTANQEFLNAPIAPSGSRELIARGDGQFCVGEPGSVGAGNPVELEPCDQQAHQAWMQYYGWSSFAGLAQPIASRIPAGSRVTLASPGTGQVSLAATAAGDTAQFWAVVQEAHGFSLQSVYEPGRCLDAPSQTAGTALDAAACGGGSGQEFTAFVQAGTETIGYKLSGSSLCVTAPASTPGPLTLETCAVPAQTDQEWVGPS